MMIRPNLLARQTVSASTDPGRERRQADGPTGGEFEKTLRTMRETMNMAMADRFLSATQSWHADDKEDPSSGGMSMNNLGLGMLTSLSMMGLPTPVPSIQAVRNAYGLPGDSRLDAAGLGLGTSGGNRRQTRNLADQVRGFLSKRFESGAQGSEAIGYDRVGGTSYGIFQLSSRQGTMDRFLSFLDSQAPGLSQRLRDAGPANTGSTDGALPETWKSIAQEFPDLFAGLQTEFIEQTHYAPALNAVAQATGFDLRNLPGALNEVLFSTAVQHGPSGAANIFTRAIESVTDNNGNLNYDRIGQLIDSVYAIRGTQFGSSTPEVQSAVTNRLRSEKSLAMAMLNNAPFSELG